MRDSLETVRYHAWCCQGDRAVVQAVMTEGAKTAVVLISDLLGRPVDEAECRAFEDRYAAMADVIGARLSTPTVRSIK
jgi:hypothetical protein